VVTANGAQEEEGEVKRRQTQGRLITGIERVLSRAAEAQKIGRRIWQLRREHRPGRVPARSSGASKA
jgi:hypothetical protein